MEKIEMVKKVDELYGLMAMEKEIKATIEKLQDEIKAEIGSSEEVFFVGDHKVSWKTCVKNAFDSKRFKEDNPRLYEQYSVQRESRTFLVK